VEPSHTKSYIKKKSDSGPVDREAIAAATGASVYDVPMHLNPERPRYVVQGGIGVGLIVEKETRMSFDPIFIAKNDHGIYARVGMVVGRTKLCLNAAPAHGFDIEPFHSSDTTLWRSGRNP
jgi:hypothetical protein